MNIRSYNRVEKNRIELCLTQTRELKIACQQLNSATNLIKIMSYMQAWVPIRTAAPPGICQLYQIGLAKHTSHNKMFMCQVTFEAMWEM